VDGLIERGHEITILTGIPNYPEGKIYSGYGLFKNNRQDYHGAKVFRVPLITRGKSKGIRLVLNYFSFVFFASLLGPFLCRGHFDQIFVWETSPITVAFPAIIMKKIKKAPLFFYVLDLWPESISAAGGINSKKIINIVGKMVKYIYKKCDYILVQSRAFIPKIQEMNVQKEKILYFPSWAEELYKPIKPSIDLERKYQLPKGFRVMFAGNIGVAQDFETILSAAEILRDYTDIHFLILGDGRRKEWVEKQIIQKNLSNTVHLLGRYPVEEMPSFFSLADVLLVTLKRDEIFSLTIPAKVQSYLACGKPIIGALDGEGAKVIQEAEAGLVGPSQDASTLAKNILNIYKKNESERAEMGVKGKIYGDLHFNRDILLNQLEEWMICSLDSCISNNRKSEVGI